MIRVVSVPKFTVTRTSLLMRTAKDRASVGTIVEELTVQSRTGFVRAVHGLPCSLTNASCGL